MRAVIQRSNAARVLISGEVVGELSPVPGLVVLVGVGPEDTAAEAELMASKIASLRIFADQNGKVNLSLEDVGGGALIVSQFTLYADVQHGRRPGFTGAAAPEVAEPLVRHVGQALQLAGIPVQSGRFGADMEVELVNDGPMTIVLDTNMWKS